MAKKHHDKSAREGRGQQPPCELPQPVDMIDGIPDRCDRGRTWKLVAIVIIFLAWLAFLMYAYLAGRPS